MTAVVGAPAHGAYVFTKTAAGWKQTAKLRARQSRCRRVRRVCGHFGNDTVVGTVGQPGRAYLFTDTRAVGSRSVT